MVVFTGDLYEGKPIEDTKVQKILKKLQPGYGKFAVLGDEDHAHADEVTNILNEGGFEVLIVHVQFIIVIVLLSSMDSLLTARKIFLIMMVLSLL